MSHRDFFACEETRVCKIRAEAMRLCTHISLCHLRGDLGDFELEMLDGIAHAYRERTALRQETGREEDRKRITVDAL